jgi:hypothetical protein
MSKKTNSKLSLSPFFVFNENGEFDKAATLSSIEDFIDSERAESTNLHTEIQKNLVEILSASKERITIPALKSFVSIRMGANANNINLFSAAVAEHISQNSCGKNPDGSPEIPGKLYNVQKGPGGGVGLWSKVSNKK